MAEYLLRALDIKKYFAGVKALDGVSLEIRPGEIHCLAGENGCGKSTLIKIISGVYQRDFGTIEFEGRPLQKITPLSAIESGIQVIYQDFSIFPNLSVMENLAINSQLVAKKKFVNWKDMRTIAEQAVARIGFTVDLDARLGELSVAEKQMVAICRALMFNAKLIIMDEPTTALTRKEVQALFRVILQLKEQGIAILFVSHKLDEVFEISERFTVFRSGKLTATGNTAELDNKKFTYYMTGREFEEKTFQPTGLSDEPLLEVRDLTLPGSYEDISFSLHGGEIRIHGKPTSIKSPRAAIENGIGFVPEDRLSEGLFLSQSIADNIVISEIDDLTKKGLVDAQKTNEEIDRWVKELAIATPDPANAASTLSGGNQQRIVLAKWLACRPQILVLNGPTVGVDIGSKHDIHAILQSLAGKGMAVIIISDDLPELLENCSRIMILKDGRIVDELTADEASEKQILSKML